MTFDIERVFRCLKPGPNDCFKDTPSTDERCRDQAFALANPKLCKGFPRLILKPEALFTVTGRETQFRAYIHANGQEALIPNGVTYASSAPSKFSIDENIGVGLAISEGDATVVANWQNFTAYGDVTVTERCSDLTASVVLVVDNSRSMTQMFGGTTATKLDYARKAARAFVDSMVIPYESIGVVWFNEDAGVQSTLQQDQSALTSAINIIPGTVQATNIKAGLDAAFEMLIDSAAHKKIIVLITDGENKEGDDPRLACAHFRDFAGVIISIGVRAHGDGFDLLESISSGGYFLNATQATEVSTLDDISKLLCWLCLVTDPVTTTTTTPTSTQTTTPTDTTTATTTPTSTTTDAPVAAQADLTHNGTALNDGETVTIGSRVYLYKTVLTGAANEVLIGAATASLANLQAAVNGDPGEGTTYGTGTAPHADVTATVLTGNTNLLFEAQVPGAAGNSISKSTTAGNLTWDPGATFSGGIG